MPLSVETVYGFLESTTLFPQCNDMRACMHVLVPVSVIVHTVNANQYLFSFIKISTVELLTNDHPDLRPPAFYDRFSLYNTLVLEQLFVFCFVIDITRQQNTCSIQWTQTIYLSSWAKIDLWQSPKSSPHNLTFLSPEPLARRVPSVEMSSDNTGSLWP